MNRYDYLDKYKKPTIPKVGSKWKHKREGVTYTICEIDRSQRFDDLYFLFPYGPHNVKWHETLKILWRDYEPV